MNSNLQSLACEVKGDTLSEMRQHLGAWHDVESQRLMDCEASETRMVLLDDRVASLKAIMEQYQTPADVFTSMNDLYSGPAARVTLSTVHRAKGLEAERVIILRPGLLPLAVTQDWEKHQEVNIEYVALTRSRRELIFVGSWQAPERDV